MSIRRSSLICVAYLQVYERVADNRWRPNIGGLLYYTSLLGELFFEDSRRQYALSDHIALSIRRYSTYRIRVIGHVRIA